jgi:O-antigen ligase
MVRTWLSFRTVVLIAPLFMLTVKHWISALVFFTSIAAMIWLLRHRETRPFPDEPAQQWRRWISWAMAGPILAVGLGQVFRGEFFLGNFDPPLRILLCVPIFLAISQGWMHRGDGATLTQNWMAWVLPLALVWTCFHRVMWPTTWGDGRYTTRFVDPLSFGSLCLMFAFLSFAGLWLFRHRSYLAQVGVVAGVACGIFLSVTSGSRTGWLSLPVFALIGLYMGMRHGRYARRWWLAAGMSLVLLGIFITWSPQFLARMQTLFAEGLNYHWHAMNPDGSTQMRISLWRMGWFYFLQSPLGGWGDLGWRRLMDSPELVVYASSYTREFAQNGFHSEVMTNAVRSGVWGLVSSVAVFAVPLVISLQLRAKKSIPMLAVALWFLWIVLLHQALAGLSTEVTALIFQASFFGLCLAVALGEAVFLSRQNNGG